MRQGGGDTVYLLRSEYEALRRELEQLRMYKARVMHTGESRARQWEAMCREIEELRKIQAQKGG